MVSEKAKSEKYNCGTDSFPKKKPAGHKRFYAQVLKKSIKRASE